MIFKRPGNPNGTDRGQIMETHPLPLHFRNFVTLGCSPSSRGQHFSLAKYQQATAVVSVIKVLSSELLFFTTRLDAD